MIHSRSEDTIERLFELTIENEYRVADIYERFKKLFSHVPGLPAFWQELHDDEIQHATTLQNVRKLLTPEQLLSCSTKEMRDSVVRLHHMLILSKDLVGSINTLDDAYQLAHQIECSEVNEIFKFLSCELIPFDKQEDMISSGIAQHQQKLLDLSRNFGDRERRKEIKIQRI